MGVLVGIIFSHTPDEAKSGGLAKACVPGKNYSVSEKIELLKEVDSVKKYCFHEIIHINKMVNKKQDRICKFTYKVK